MITEIRTEGGTADIFGVMVPRYNVVGVYDATAATRDTYMASDYARLVADLGAAQAASLAAQAGWAV